ncbi:hypothetical protein ACTI_83970 [Actinoplanes sp. OR16]|uniref:hypothetical protein n=1 Tax=Actinoplanes sp. OR16 TaxID=946334 RepID=UPI000F6D6E31|nr:hypothetical protein [Actinoplanes sp. OR16]BBH71712.1 hypothetical protein ACTI_83970 [Actinoplanes sp. OR16]
MTYDDPILARIGQAVEINHGQRRRDDARALFAGIWQDIGGEQGDPFHVCLLAHVMADTQDDVGEELRWDLIALAAADRIRGDEVLAQAGVPLSVGGLYPSLHLSVSDCYRRLGDLDRAREHLNKAREGMPELGDDNYGTTIRNGLATLAEQLGPE